MKTIQNALKMFLCLGFLTGVIYPLLITLIAQLTMSHQANGSFIIENEKNFGSSLIAQKFESDRYFWPRPSANNYDPLPSGGSNLGPTSLDLKKIVDERRAHLEKQHFGQEPAAIPSELLFASASGLDPHVTPATVYFQLDRVLKARKLEQQKDRVAKIIEESTEGRFLGLIGRPCINVLKLNLALDKLQHRP